MGQVLCMLLNIEANETYSLCVTVLGSQQGKLAATIRFSIATVKSWVNTRKSWIKYVQPPEKEGTIIATSTTIYIGNDDLGSPAVTCLFSFAPSSYCIPFPRREEPHFNVSIQPHTSILSIDDLDCGGICDSRALLITGFMIVAGER